MLENARKELAIMESAAGALSNVDGGGDGLKRQASFEDEQTKRLKSN